MSEQVSEGCREQSGPAGVTRRGGEGTTTIRPLITAAEV